MMAFKAHQNSVSERGYTMLIMLIFVGFFAALITGIVLDRNESDKRQLAIANGVYLSEVARASRLFVRDRSINRPSATATPAEAAASIYHPLRLSTAAIADVGDGTASFGPTNENGTDAIPNNDVITIADLIGAGLLSPAFSLQTPMGQNVTIIAANVPINGDSLDPTQHVVASAYVFVQSTTPEHFFGMNDTIIGLRQSGVSVSGIDFDTPAGGNIMPATCRGVQPVALWDTGCLTQAEYEALGGLASGTPFPPGSIIIPTWRAEQFDLRAMMRYPQPENRGYATMLTPLNMAGQNWERDASGDLVYRDSSGAIVDAGDSDANLTCVSSNLSVNADDPTAPVDTGICSFVNDDVATATDNRFDIRNVGAIEAGGVVITPQFDTASGANLDVISYYDAATDSYLTRTVNTDLSNDPTLREGVFVSGDAHLRNDLVVFDPESSAPALGIEMPATGPTTTGADEIRINFANTIVRNSVSIFGDPGGTAILGDTIVDIRTLNANDINADTFVHSSIRAAGAVTAPATPTPFELEEMVQSNLRINGNMSMTGDVTIEEANIFANNAAIGVAGRDDAISMAGATSGVGTFSLNATGGNVAGRPARVTAGSIDGQGSLTVGTATQAADLRIESSATFGANSDVVNGGSLHVRNAAGTARCFGPSSGPGNGCPQRCPSAVSFPGTICPLP